MTRFDIKMLGSPEASKNRVLHLSGDAFEQGRQHGAAVPDLMRANLDVVRGQLAHSKSRGIGQAYRDAAHFVETRQPGLWREFQGMAEGSGLPFEDVLTLNLKVASVLGWLDVECSQIVKVVHLDDGSSRTLMCKTRDQKGGPVEHVVLLRHYDDGQEMLEVQKAGIISYPGSILTSDGFGLGTSGVWCARTPFDRSRLAEADIGPSSHQIMRQSKSLDDIVGLLEQQPRLTGINYTVARPGEVAAVEVTANAARLIPGSRGQVVRTNHYFTPEFAELSPRPDEYTSTFHRFSRIEELLPHIVTPEDMWQLAQDHVGHPQDSVCRHRTTSASGSFTTYASVFILEELTAYVGLGNPCEIAFSK
ncbi:C45 family autoproteolytic acyltransferase/hydolase [Devosia sp. A449]